MRQQLEADIKAALLSGDKEKSSALNFIKSAILLLEKEQGSSLNDEQMIAFFRKEVKKRQESADLFDKGGRPDSAVKERYEIDLITSYLPEQMSDEQIVDKLKSIIAEQQIPLEQASMGRLIGTAKTALGSDADPSSIARLAAQILKGEI